MSSRSSGRPVGDQEIVGQSASDVAPPCGTAILIVDDDRELSAIVGRQLEREGYLVRSAANGAEALALLQEDELPATQLIVLDLEMPVMDGWGMLAALRRWPAMRGRPVIVTSSAPQSSIARRWAELGSAFFLRKPVELEALLVAVTEGLRAAADAEPRVA